MSKQEKDPNITWADDFAILAASVSGTIRDTASFWLVIVTFAVVVWPVSTKGIAGDDLAQFRRDILNYKLQISGTLLGIAGGTLIPRTNTTNAARNSNTNQQQFKPTMGETKIAMAEPKIEFSGDVGNVDLGELQDQDELPENPMDNPPPMP